MSWVGGAITTAVVKQFAGDARTEPSPVSATDLSASGTALPSGEKLGANAVVLGCSIVR